MAKKTKTDPVVESMMRALQELFTGMMCHCVMHNGPALAISTLEQLREHINAQIEDVKKLAAEAMRPDSDNAT